MIALAGASSFMLATMLDFVLMLAFGSPVRQAALVGLGTGLGTAVGVMLMTALSWALMRRS